MRGSCTFEVCCWPGCVCDHQQLRENVRGDERGRGVGEEREGRQGGGGLGSTIRDDATTQKGGGGVLKERPHSGTHAHTRSDMDQPETKAARAKAHRQKKNERKNTETQK